MSGDPQAVMRDFKPTKKFFIGIDSDGCAFDTMEIKHKECFIPNIIKHWRLQAVSKYAREAGEFVNLYSRWRGINRFPALIMVFDLLREREEVKRRNVTPPEAQSLRDWIKRESKLANPALKAEVQKTGDPILTQALQWSEAVNKAIEDMVFGVPPFPFVRESLERMAAQADVMCVSATPGEALIREWQEHDIAKYTRIIAGQEMGSKKQHLALTAGGKYPPDRILMIGDAPGDLDAARANSALFFPIVPGREEKSWELFYNEAMYRFFSGSYAGDYEKALIDDFLAGLPETPPWKK